MARMMRGAAFAALGASIALAVAGCSSSDGGGGNDATADANNPVEMSLWTNATTGPGAAFFEDTVKSFEAANPGVTIKIQTVQNEDLDGKLQTALNSGDAPDMFLQRGGGKMAAMVEAGQLMDITDSISSDTKAGVGEGAFKAESIDGKTYAMPVSRAARWLLLQPGPLHGGRHHRRPPKTLDELNAANAKLKAPASRRSRSVARTPGPPRTGTTGSRCASAARTC